MRLVSIIVPRAQLHNLLSYAGRSEVLHLVEVPENKLPDGVSKYDLSSVFARTSAIKSRIALLSSATGPSELPTPKLDAPLDSVDKLAAFLDSESSRIEEPLRQLEDSETKLRGERERTSELARFLSGLESAGIPLRSLEEGSFLNTLAGEASAGSVASLQDGLAEVTYGNTIFVVTSTTETTETFIALFPSAFADEARQAASSLGAKIESSWADLPPDLDQAKRQIDSRLQEIETSSKNLEHERDSFLKEQGPRVKELSQLTELLEARTKAVAGSPATETTIMFRAWVPAYRAEELAKSVSEVCDGECSVVIEKLQEIHNHSRNQGADYAEVSTLERSQPPTLINIPNWFKPIQSIINNFGIPNYNELNPLPFMIFSYPIIFGLMFGDFGQGPLFILFGLLFLRLKKKGGKIPGGDIGRLIVGGAELMILLGIGTTVFGFLFGDFFGFESAQIFGIHPLFSPTEGALTGDIEHLQQFMVIILWFGVGHYTLGLALNAYGKIRHHEYAEAFFGPISWAWFYLAFVNLVRLFILGLGPSEPYKFSALIYHPIEIGLFVVPFGLFFWKEGGLHGLEAFTSMGSNTLSYLRIWALNIADFFVKVALFTAFGIGGAIGGNLLVMMIEGLIVFVQTLRLHWVEWFSKFYEGNGLPFAPYTEPMGLMVQTRA